MGKRKRPSEQEEATSGQRNRQHDGRSGLQEHSVTTQKSQTLQNEKTITVQVIVGTYQKVLHGVSATISQETGQVEFEDTFLLASHTSAIRCLALSPQSLKGDTTKLLLATGGSDQDINLYQLSRQRAAAPVQEAKTKRRAISLLSSNETVKRNPGNRELGSLQHHAGGVNALCFPTRSKLMSASEDCTIAVTRTRDWTMLSVVKAPMPKARGRPSGDTAPLGGTPAGINDFAIHPSLKLMVSVGKGEKCMRLWNLMTGKKAGVLNFERSVLQRLGENKWTGGEGQKVRWTGLGEEFVVAFDRGCVVYGLDSKVRACLLTSPPSKIHQLRYAALDSLDTMLAEFLLVSTEDGRLCFFSTESSQSAPDNDDSSQSVSTVRPIAQLGGVAEGLVGRIKDFEVVNLPEMNQVLVITAYSDGAIRIWALTVQDGAGIKARAESVHTAGQTATEPKQVGRLLGTYEAGNRITCLAAFRMLEPEVNAPPQ